ncbi:LysR family transcriptional regulator [Roseibium suaedae]|uniref:Transcriptional regulator, LysR family n=1 Tax=Roseibium suaedae TaxID=735517 RepID=A0A1M7ALC2_9HYPH|nr:LysR substrate-binding domain-containing protein [Roseibium suaedae]SHL43582.1 transcriptional regulator, LysR family [Roseibium suaedae]
MTLEQLAIFIAVAEREHLTRAADHLHLTPSAVSSALKKLEATYGVALFDRVGRGLCLTNTGKTFLEEARATLARAQTAERVLADLGNLQRGAISIYASQTIASYWLPPVLMRFHAAYPGIDLSLTISNTAGVAAAITQGIADVGYIEGALDNPLLRRQHLIEDALTIVTSPDHPFASRAPANAKALITETTWVLREKGSGTRSEFESALIHFGETPSDLKIILEFPSNEAILSAVRFSQSAGVISKAAAAASIAEGVLTCVDFALPSRTFSLLGHKERHLSAAAAKLVSHSLEEASRPSMQP